MADNGRRGWLRVPWAVVLAVLVSAVGVAASVITGVVLHGAEARTAERVMDQRTEVMRMAVATEARRYVETLHTVTAATGALPELTAAGFAAVTAPLAGMNLPGATAVVFVVPGADRDVATLQGYWRERGAGGLELRPLRTGTEHLFTVFQRRLHGTALPPPGIDVSQAPEPAEAIRKARRTGAVTVSAAYRLLADRELPVEQQQMSFILTAPVYAVAADGGRAAFRGWLVMGMRGQDFVGATIRHAAQGLAFSTLLARDGARWQQVATERSTSTGLDLRRETVVAVADQQWLLRADASRAALPGGETHLDDGLTTAGLLLTALITALVLILATGRQRARNRVTAATADLRVAEAEARRQAGLLGAVMDSISDGVGVVNDRGEFLLHNPAAKKILGITDDIDGADNWQSHYGLFHPDGVTPYPTDELPLVRAVAGETCDNVELITRNANHPDGVWLNVSARPLDARAGQAGAVAVFHDITDRKTAEARVRASEERMRLLLDGARDHAIVMLDADGRVASWSGNAERIKGYPADEIIGQPYSTFFTPEAVAAGEPARNLAQAGRDGRVEGEGVRVRKDGTRFWAHGVLTALTDDAGRVTGFVKVTRDVTARRRAEAKFRDLLEAAPDAILGCAADGTIVLVNNKVEQLFGYRREELLGQQVEVLVPEAVRAGHTGHRERYLRHPVARPMGAGTQLSGRRRDGTLFPAEISLSTLETEDGVLVSAAVRDITDRVVIQQQLSQLNERLQGLNGELERRVDERTAQLRAQAEQLRAANEELESFSYSVSHDLRAPLRAVDGFANVLALDHGDRLDESGRRYLAKVRAGAQQMGQLIDGLLAFSRLQRQAMSYQPVRLAGLVADVWEELAVDRADRDIVLHVGDLPVAEGDPRLLRHVLANLLGNAVKYTRGRDHARVEVGSLRDAHGAVVYFVRDNGTGFDMRYADKLFKVFQRLHRAEDYEGTGIGLALTARIVHRHGGRIWAEAAPERGATFHFTIPADGTATRTEEFDHEVAADPGVAGRGQPGRPGARPARV